MLEKKLSNPYVNFLFVNVILGQNFVPDTDEVKQKPSLFSVVGKNLLGIVSWILFFCFTSSVSGTYTT